MKGIQELIINALFWGVFSFTVSAQSPNWEALNIDKTNSSVVLSWTMTAGSFCNGIKIYRSESEVGFIEIGQILGVCGDISNDKHYVYSDTDPLKNKVNYYKLEFGSGVFSEVISIVFIDLSENNYTLYPNPIELTSKLYFNNSNGQTVELLIYDLQGNQIYAAETNLDYFDLNLQTAENGKYVFRLVTKKNIIQGQLLVNH